MYLKKKNIIQFAKVQKSDENDSSFEFIKYTYLFNIQIVLFISEE